MANAKKTTLNERIKGIVTFLDRLFYPKGLACVDCFTELTEEYRELSLCPKCLESLPYRDSRVCPICATYVPTAGVCPRCRNTEMPFEHTHSLFEYTGVIRNMLNNYKDNDRPWLYEYIAKLLVPYALSLNLEVDYIFYVPSSPTALKLRGFEHAERVAKELAKALKIPLLVPLERIKKQGDQTKLTYAKRIENVQNAFVMRKDFDPSIIKDKRLLLYDDTMTTGATAIACSKLLKKAGAKSITVITLARS